MLNTIGLSREEKEAFLETFHELDKCFSIAVDNEISLPFHQLELFKNYLSVEFRDALRINEGKGKACITFVQVEYTYIGYKGGHFKEREYQAWAVAQLPKWFGHVLIKPETFRDKLVELFQPIELNFPEDKEFCNRFYVLAKDSKKAFELLNADFRTELKRILVPDFYLEVLDDYLVIGNKKVLNKKESLALASFVYNVSELNYSNK